MGKLLIGLVASLLALALFSVAAYRLPIEAALGPIAGAAVMIAVLLAHLWARERREARG
jgi:hypothetical protein